VLLGSAHAEIQSDGRTTLTIGRPSRRHRPASKKAAFDAVLVDSHLLGTLILDGGGRVGLLGATSERRPDARRLHPADNPDR